MKRINAILPVQRVGWVEQSDTHQLHLMQTMGLAGSTYLRAPLVPRMLRSAISKRRMGGAKRYPSIASYEDDGFRRLNPSYVLNLHWSFAALFMRKTDGVDNETGSSDLPVGRSGASRREGEERDVIASEAKQSMLSLWRDGLLRFARNDGSTNELSLAV